MRRVAPLVFALTLLLSSALPAGSNDALARPRHGRSSRKASKSRAHRQTEIKLKDAPPVTDEQTAQTSAPPPSRGPTRIDFDDRLVQGQTNKSGAVYLYERKELKQRSMVKKRDSFRDEIISSVYDSE